MHSLIKKITLTSIAVLALASVATVNADAAKHHTKVATKTAKRVKKTTASYYKVSYAENAAYAKSTGIVTVFNKPGRLSGAKVVASKKTMKQLAKSTSPKDVFYVYGMAKTNTGLYYAHIVTLGGKYRGWVYVGKHDISTDLNNIDRNTGIVATKTLTYASLPKKNTNIKISNSLWTFPNYSRINAKVIPHKKTTYIKDTFTIDGAVKNTLGWTYYHVTDNKKKNIDGWIFSKNISTTMKSTTTTNTDKNNTPTDPYTLTFNYNGSPVNTVIVSVKNDLTVNGTAKVNADTLAKFIPSGYQITTDANAINTDGPIVSGGKAIINLAPKNVTRIAIQLKQNGTNNVLTPSTSLNNTLTTIANDLLANKSVFVDQPVNADVVKAELTSKNITTITQSDLGLTGAGSLTYTGVDTTKIDGNNPVITIYFQ